MPGSHVLRGYDILLVCAWSSLQDGTDRSLVDYMKAPDLCMPSDALADAFARMSPRLRRIFARRVPAHEIDDLMQDVFLRAHSRTVAASSIDYLERYLFTVASSVLIDRARRRTVRKTSLHQPMDEAAHPHEHLTPERIALDREALESIIDAIDELTPRTRDILVLHRFEECSCPAIAARFGISVSAVEKHLMKALQHLHQRLFPG